MKIRQGFVSNSSSGSFVLVWKLPSEYDDVAKFICDIFSVNYDSEKHILKTEFRKDYCNDEDLAIKAIDRTKHLGGDTYETSAFTGMLNDVSDFGIEFLSFVTLLVANKVQIISAEIENDN